MMRERGVKSYVASLFSLSLYVPKRVGTYSYLLYPLKKNRTDFHCF